MIEAQQLISGIADIVSNATKSATSITALFTQMTAAKNAAAQFLSIFPRKKSQSAANIGVKEFMGIKNDTVFEAKNLRGVLVPIIEFAGEDEANYIDVSQKIKNEISKRGAPTPENEFLTVYSQEWRLYGCSLQSNLNTNHIQLLSLVETEEANRTPLLVSSRYYNKMLHNDRIGFGLNSSVSGLAVPITNRTVFSMLGRERAERLELSGHTNVIIPDEELINSLSGDISFNPGIYFNNEKCFFLGYLWAIYVNIHSLQIIPIYEYGNLGDKHSLEILLAKLISQIEFFKKRIWHEANRPSNERNFKLILSYNDMVHKTISDEFGEGENFPGREELLILCQRSVLNNLI